MQQNNDYVVEVKKEVAGDSVTLNVSYRNGSSSPCDNNKRGHEREKKNESHDEIISVDGSINMDDDSETASPQKILRLSENNQSLDDDEIEKRLQEFVSRMTSSDQSYMMEKRMCSKCNKLLEINEYLKHMKNEHCLFACPLCDWFRPQLGHLLDHMHSQHKVVISSKKICGIKVGTTTVICHQWS
ncbi:unnamed protein product [Mytilus coruscus]|uniref:Uncharacterized protein n=1 Tax=Mytilus coruscus TaxID=42192 RepID=A0A6J8A1A2_MYTCO|nr:unnamed protein product [Mytilus coruscus]